ncbi:MAG TPA: methylated-DNA--[protein]-cysteine S-methyltransferase [Solirubrobacterales bacterium]|jgi:methylated-DNA-[protein]-cysteine S-methyltransferase|nr:methylated-DNA--[protein]-cysteine S-methyltransferase [Solirubrobacterales bacterium]
MSDSVAWDIYESPIGPLTVIAGEAGLRGLWFPGKVPTPPESARASLPMVTEQLEAYFGGERREFDLELELRGAPLDREVWRRLLDIPYGATENYGELAARVDPDLFGAEVEPWQRARVVGAANGRNPVAIVVPCHRVIGADGSLIGYGGGLHRKRALLELEGSGRPDPAWSTRQTSLL